MSGDHETASSPEAPGVEGDEAAPVGIVGPSGQERLAPVRGRVGRASAARAASRRRGSSRLAVAGGWLVLLAVVLGLGAFVFLRMQGTARAAAPAAAQTTTGSQIAAGAALFQQSCAACHGPSGQGVTLSSGEVLGINIQNVGAAAADFVLRTGRMPLAVPGEQMVRGQPKFTTQQISDLVAYVASLGKGPAIPTVDVNGANLVQGRALFIQNCAACHAPSGAGDAIGGGFDAPSLMQSSPLDVAEAMRIGPIPMPKFSSSAFSQQDVNDIAAYVQYLQNVASPGGLTMGAVGPVPEGFIAFVVGLTSVYLIIRFIARRGIGQRAEAEAEAAAHSGGDESEQ